MWGLSTILELPDKDLLAPGRAELPIEQILLYRAPLVRFMFEEERLCQIRFGLHEGGGTRRSSQPPAQSPHETDEKDGPGTRRPVAVRDIDEVDANDVSHNYSNTVMWREYVER
jgi:hypothetical protein